VALKSFIFNFFNLFFNFFYIAFLKKWVFGQQCITREATSFLDQKPVE